MTAIKAVRLVAVLLLAAVALTACSDPTDLQPAATQSTGSTTFACPSTVQLASLTAIKFAGVTRKDTTCAYTGMVDGNPAEVTIQHPAATQGRLPTLAASRAAQPRTTVVQAATRFSADAFLARATDRSCTAYVYATDGVITAVTARRAGPEALHSCDLASSAAALMGTRAHTAVPVVSLVAGAGMLPAAATAPLDSVFHDRLGVRVDIESAGVQGYTGRGGREMATLAASVDPRTSAVVFVTGPVDGSAGRLTVLHDATTALAAAHARAPRARLVVVGPAGAGDTPTAAVLALREDLSAAARIAGADFIDPIDAGWGSGAETSAGTALAAAAAGRLGQGVASALVTLMSSS